MLEMHIICDNSQALLPPLEKEQVHELCRLRYLCYILRILQQGVCAHDELVWCILLALLHVNYMIYSE